MATPTDPAVRMRLDERDERTHPIEAAHHFNESMYINVFDHALRVGGWFRVGNRPNEGHAEMSCCLYLPNGRVAFLFARPEKRTNDDFEAAGLSIEVSEPFRALRVRYDGPLCLLSDPQEMENPKAAFANNPRVPCRVELTFEGVSPMFGGEAVDQDGNPLPEAADEAFARGHYEQHVAGKGTFVVGDETFAIDGLGLRDHSWGPRYWQNLHFYRWLPMSFTRDFALNVSLVNMASGKRVISGMVLRDGQYETVSHAALTTDYDERKQARGQTLRLTAGGQEYVVTGRRISMIPLRNRRRTDTGEERATRITEAFTEYRCGDRVGYGMAECLDQLVNDQPSGFPS